MGTLVRSFVPVAENLESLATAPFQRTLKGAVKEIAVPYPISAVTLNIRPAGYETGALQVSLYNVGPSPLLFRFMTQTEYVQGIPVNETDCHMVAFRTWVTCMLDKELHIRTVGIGGTATLRLDFQNVDL